MPYIEAKRQPQSTCQAETVIDSSLIPSVALLVAPYTLNNDRAIQKVSCKSCMLSPASFLM